jgi:hypothetical protein
MIKNKKRGIVEKENRGKKERKKGSGMIRNKGKKEEGRERGRMGGYIPSPFPAFLP